MIPHPYPPECTREYFLALLDGLLAGREVRRVEVGGVMPCARRPGQARERVIPPARILVLLAGEQTYGLSHAGQYHEHRFVPGDGLYWAPHAWQLENWERPCRFFGLVFRETCLRVILVDHAGGGPPAGPTPWSYHTGAPLAGAARPLLETFDTLAALQPESPAAMPLFEALLRLAREHLAADEAAPPGSKAERTWQLALDYVREHYTQPITRETVAAVLRVHPNYLSALARQRSGESFQHLLTRMRMDGARRLLRETDLKLDRVAELCGYQSARYFVSAFRRVTGETPGRWRKGVQG